MSDEREYISPLMFVALCYAGFGFFGIEIFPENVLLGGILVIIGGLIPNLDTNKGAGQHDLLGIIAATSPVFVFSQWPELANGGVSRQLLVILTTYLAVKMVIFRILDNFTAPRGLFHSLPGAVIAGQLSYLLLFDLYHTDRLFLAGGVALGYVLHLVLDAAGDVRSRDLSKPAMKIVAKSGGSTLLLYAIMAGLSFLIVTDIHPEARFQLPFAQK